MLSSRRLLKESGMFPFGQCSSMVLANLKNDNLILSN